MATCSINLQGVTAALGYQYDDATRFLAKPDPEHTPIRFTLHIAANSALFDLVIPIKYKAKTTSKSINLRLNPLSITSLEYSTRTDLPDAIKSIFPSATCLELSLRQAAAILIPSFIKEPVEVARRRSGLILNSLYELSHVTKLSIYIPDTSLSLDQLQSISTAITHQNLQPFSGPDYDISRMFSGSGAKATTLPAPLPPSYDKIAATEVNAPLYSEAATFDPPNTRSRKRKPSQEAVPDSDSDAVWKKLGRLEEIFTSRATQDSLLIQELRADVIQLQDQLATYRTKNEELEMEVANLREVLATVNDGEIVELVEIRDDIKSMESRIDFIERGKDDDELGKKIKGEIFDEMAARVKGC
ncbi:hypothetical protein ACHAQD_008427 [Fusarium lateritium]